VSPLADAAFALDGRLSARRGADAVAVGFAWVHEPPRDTLVVTSPLGQTLAELEGDTGLRRARLTLADGRTAEDDDWAVLTGRMLGFPLPVDALAAWVRASPHAGSAYVVEADGSGRVSLLRQDGWEIAYGYPDADARRPARRHRGADRDRALALTGAGFAPAAADRGQSGHAIAHRRCAGEDQPLPARHRPPA
jgi:outer membrane biogenesis lipoprotein LolB